MAYMVAVPASPALVMGIEDFVNAVKHDRNNSAELYIRMVDHMTDRMLSLFMIEPSQMITLSSTQTKVIDFAVATAGKASHMLSRQIYKKVSNKEFAPIVARFSQLYWPAGEDNDNQAHLRFAIDDVFAIEFMAVAEQCAAGQGEQVVDRMSAVMDRLSDEIIQNFFVANNDHVKMGFVTQKAVDIGIDGSRKAIRAVNHKVLKGLNASQLKGFMGHYAPIVRAV
ncbi:hypothetical protein [Alcanivorax sp. 1008]|uniref:hypothetical protein n=1 Tax=Alcanivorax sp. 1008 TaxID=2816853 RepID=UPI001DED10C0|nr:hypothetical protein [Alcanivorax sp. 1008]MCC1495483.1 hypothetical protein [Alcanivorax sp. 1008]